MSVEHRSLALALVPLAFAMTACAHTNIPGTEIEDTDDNRKILAIVEEYQNAVERLDAVAVLALVSPRYYENNGNTDAADDYDFDGLAASLRASFGRTKAMQLVLRIDDIQVEEDAAFAEVYYEIRSQNNYPSGLKWETETDRSRLKFERVDNKWLIVAGL